MKKLVIGLIALVIIAGGAFALSHKSSPKKAVSNDTSKPAATPATNKQSTAATTPTNPASPAPVTTQPTNPAPAAASSPLHVTVHANDTSASPETITASSGQVVTITFDVSTTGTYHGGLQFKSSNPNIDSGPIAEGSSKDITFTATKSFRFTPFWYASSVQKDYFVTVTVK